MALSLDIKYALDVMHPPCNLFLRWHTLKLWKTHKEEVDMDYVACVESLTLQECSLVYRIVRDIEALTYSALINRSIITSAK